MELLLRIRFFESALDGTSAPSFSESNPFLAQLLVEGQSRLFGVKLLGTEQGGLVRARPASSDIDYSVLEDGTEFFVVDGTRYSGRGVVERLMTSEDNA